MDGIVESGARGIEQQLLKENIEVVRKRHKNESMANETTMEDKKNEQHNVVEDQEEEDDNSYLSMPVDLLYVPKNCAEQLEHFANYMIETGWRVLPHHALPSWLRDNEYLLWGHRPPLPSFKACLESCFRIHTETGNIWTHFIGAVMFAVSACYFLAGHELDLKEKLVFLAFFLAAISCLMFSAMFHAFCCYSPSVSRLFSKLDYCGIAILIVGSYVPWLYYAFYCDASTIAIYSTLMCVMAAICIVVSLWDRFGAPEYRVIRAGIFIALGSCGVIPGIHYLVSFGSQKAFNVGALSWFLCTALLYLIGASLYAARIPERLFPGRFDIWFQSHQIFHVFVVAAAYVHYCGITRLASYRLTIGDCLTAHTQSDFSFEF